jgi:hypothetical protein
MPEYLTAGDVAKEVGDITAMGVKAASERGDLPVAAITRGGVRLYRIEDVKHFKESRETRRNR